MGTKAQPPDLPRSRSVATVCIFAMAALAVAMGVGRFAFTPLLPLMVRDGLLEPGSGAWLAGSNYLGYMLGALIAGTIPVSSQAMLRFSLVGIALLTAAMGVSNDLPSWLALRFAAGVLSAWALVSTSAWALGQLARAERPHLAGFVYAGVGVGIALVGAYCVAAARPGAASSSLWVEIGGLSGIIIAVPVLLLDRWSPAASVSPRPVDKDAATAGSTGLVICYGIFGFGYILPATFLPALAREIIDDPRIFGLAWPVFGLAAALSTIVAARTLQYANRLRAWAVSHVIMAVGVVVPSLWLSQVSIAISALFVGCTFVVVTMIGMQEARARSPSNPTPLLSKMTAAFAIGQLAGPLMSAALGLLPGGLAVGLNVSLQVAALALGVSAAYVYRLADEAPHRMHLDANNAAG